MMTIVFERTTGDPIERPGLLRGIACGSGYESPEPASFAVDRRRNTTEDTSSSSSIGRNSDSDSGDGSGSGDGEVQSQYKEPLDCLEALEEVLPMKRGMSKFYNGKSKSFTSLADVSLSSIKEIVKPDNALTRKRKNLLAHAIFWDKNHDFPPKNKIGSIVKKPTNSNRSTSTVSSAEGNDSDTCNSNASSPVLRRPPLHPQSHKNPLNDESSSSPACRNFSPWRSFSLCDLQGAAAANPTTALLINKGDKDKAH